MGTGKMGKWEKLELADKTSVCVERRNESYLGEKER